MVASKHAWFAVLGSVVARFLTHLSGNLDAQPKAPIKILWFPCTQPHSRTNQHRWKTKPSSQAGLELQSATISIGLVIDSIAFDKLTNWKDQQVSYAENNQPLLACTKSWHSDFIPQIMKVNRKGVMHKWKFVLFCGPSALLK